MRHRNNYPPFYGCVFHNVSFGDQCITQRCNYTVWPLRELASRPGAIPGGLISTRRPAIFFAVEVPVKPTMLNTLLLLLFFKFFVVDWKKSGIRILSSWADLSVPGRSAQVEPKYWKHCLLKLAWNQLAPAQHGQKVLCSQFPELPVRHASCTAN